MVVGFTGHRPDKLGGYDWNSPKNKEVMRIATDTIIEIIEKHPGEKIHFVVGGAIGFDQMAFHICNNLKRIYKNIEIEVAVPFRNQDIKWLPECRKRWENQLFLADTVTEVDTLPNYSFPEYKVGEFYPLKMQKRNEYMVDKSDIMIAEWDGSSGGTGNCVNYARKKKRDLIILNPKEITIY